ncbi:hypothetical protein [Vibrio navarrensis]|uniref:hypothetical protein n=1 Tax=Vibrio navarrensis TaxID=29495 RepID=UPI0018699175|nr:hypothetical protein [Vibrio navarrensis]MBE4618015.1 hypothetical protein [Vibrio navarrensis]
MLEFLLVHKLFAPLATFAAAALAFFAIFVNQYYLGKRLEREILSRDELQEKELILKQVQEMAKAKLERLEELFTNIQKYKASLIYHLEYHPFDIFEERIEQEQLVEYYSEFENLVVKLKSHRLRADLISKMYVPKFSKNMKDFELAEVSVLGAIIDAKHAVSLNDRYREVFPKLAEVPESIKLLVNVIDRLEQDIVEEASALQQV